MGCFKSRFGEVMGVANGVPAYRNDGMSFSSGYAKFHDQDVYTGAKYQCVEYARRYLIMTKGVTFQDIGTAHQIFALTHAIDLQNNEQRIFRSFEQGGTEPPKEGDLIIWARSRNQWWGHVAVVSKVENNLVSLAEQNYHTHWDSPDYSRQVYLKKENNCYTLTNQRPNLGHHWDVDEIILGWKRVE